MAAKGQAPAKAAAKSIMTDAGITAKTGHGWEYWFAALDKAGAAKLDHKGITQLLDRKFKPGPWWGQMIAVSYERARAEALGLDCKVGLMSRPERIIVLTTGFVLARWYVLSVAVYLLAVLTTFTVLQRILHVRRQLLHDVGGRAG